MPHQRRSIIGDRSEDEKLYQLRRKKMLNEDDEKPSVNNQLGRILCYIYGISKEGRTVTENMDAATEHIKKTYGIKYPWVGGRIFEQDGSKNKAVIDGKEVTVMSACCYAGAPSRPEIMDYAVERVRKSGPNFGSACVLGLNDDVDRLNRAIAQYYKRAAGMAHVSGFLASYNVMDVLITSGKGKSVVFGDAYVHRSLRHGAKGADLQMYFKHNDAQDFLRLVKKYGEGYDNKICMIESVYSIHGDICDLPAFRKACDEAGCILVCDDAHGIGACGPNSGGVEDYWDMPGACDYICGTFSKSCSAQGGYIVSNNKTIIEMMIISSGVGFATGMNSFSAAYAYKALEYIKAEGKALAEESDRLRNYFIDTLIKRFGDDIKDTLFKGPSRLLSITIQNPVMAIHMQEELIKEGYFVCAALFPAIEAHYSLIRLSIIPRIYTEEMIDGFIDALAVSFERCSHLEDNLNTELLYSSLALSEQAAATGSAKFSSVIKEVK